MKAISKKKLSADGMVKTLRKMFLKIEDKRVTKKCSITLTDALMSAFGVFSLKFPSLLQYEEKTEKRTTLKNLFKLDKPPSDTQMRAIIDEVDPKSLRPAFKKLFADFQRSKGLEGYRYIDGHYILTKDGTGFFSSDKVFCENCLTKKKKGSDTITYSHQALAACIVHPNKKTPIPLCPEPIMRKDGSKKNDCERNASKRFLKDFKREHPHLKIIIVEDALSAINPMWIY